MLYWAFVGKLIALFMGDPEIVEIGAMFLRGFALALPCQCLDFLAVAVFQAVGLGRYALLFAVLRKVVLEIPALLLLNFRAVPGHRRSGAAGAAVPAAGAGAGGPCRRSGVVCQSFHALPALFR